MDARGPPPLFVSRFDPGAKYWLARHIHACAVSSGVVILDLKNDKYLGIGPDQAAALSLVVGNWPKLESEAPLPDGQAVGDFMRLAERLTERGLLTRGAAEHSQSASTQSVPEATTPVGLDRAHRPKIRLLHVYRFLSALASAAIALRFRSLNSVVERVQARKAAADSIRRDVRTREAEELVAWFRHLRPYAFSAHGRCVLHALALCNFLAKYDIYPTWVFGVQTSPFAAHSWVQEGCLIFDSTPEDVRRFTPILAI